MQLEEGPVAGDNVFAKVKGLIRDMLDQLMAEAAAETSEKAHYKEETAHAFFFCCSYHYYDYCPTRFTTTTSDHVLLPTVAATDY